MKYKHEKIIKKNYLRQINSKYPCSDEEMDLCYRLVSIVANHNVNKRERLKLINIESIKVEQKIRIGGKLRDFYSITEVPGFNLIYLSFGSTSSYFRFIWLENEA